MSWTRRFPGLSGLEPDARATLEERSRLMRLPADTTIFGPGKAPDSLLLLLAGSVRVQQTTEGGREIVLYRVHAGESCVLTTACLLAGEEYTAEGITETDIEAVAIPRTYFNQLLATSDVFRRLVFGAYSKRITELFLVIEEIAFQRMDVRLAHKLDSLADDDDEIHVTHQKMAAELGTAREVVSRQMAEFQRRGWIDQSRGSIRLRDRGAIRSLALTSVS